MTRTLSSWPSRCSSPPRSKSPWPRATRSAANTSPRPAAASAATPRRRKAPCPSLGGRALKTPFGTFYGPNITPDKKAGIGNWTEADFMRALRLGDRPDGSNYFPAFPYPSFTKITDGDARDLWAYLRTLPREREAEPGARSVVLLRLALDCDVLEVVLLHARRVYQHPGLSEVANRGAYLVQALGHCSECHTPRNFSAARNRAASSRRQGARRQERAEPHADRAEEAERQEIEGLPHHRHDAPTATSPPRRWARWSQNTHQPAHARPTWTRLIAYLRTLPPLPTEKRS